MSRLPLRLRLTLAFAVAMAVVLGAMALFVYLRVGNALLTSIDQDLRAASAEARNQLRRAGAGERQDLIDPDTARGATLAQVLNGSGAVVRSTQAGLAPLVDGETVAHVRAGTAVLHTTDLPGRRQDWRLLAIPVKTPTGVSVLVIAGSLSSRQVALHRLLLEFAAAGPIALLLASLAGYGLATAALRPVESMRRRAAAISASTPGSRLPVPSGRDEIARLAQTLNGMLARLEGAFEHERRFVADASHELRTPLTLLRTELEVALRRPRSREELEAALRSASEETERLTRLTEDLLLIARSDQGHLPIRRELLEADQLLESAATRFSARARRQGRPIVVLDRGRLFVSADRARLEQALENMLDNALKHGRGTIELSARRRGPLVELHVRDEGPGFPAEFLPRAFDRFSRADEARSRGGTGLGLSIVELVAEAHGGEAGASSRSGGGADVWIAVQTSREPALSDKRQPVARQALS
jgi:two-component system OmpR family sensor kinase